MRRRPVGNAFLPEVATACAKCKLLPCTHTSGSMKTDSSLPENRNEGYGMLSGPDGPARRPPDPTGPRVMIVFGIGTRLYALPVGDVQECVPAPALSPLPVELPHLPGWFWLGDARVPVIDLAVLMGVRPAVPLRASDLLYRPLLLCRDPALRWVALLVDRVVDVMEVGCDTIMPIDIDRGVGDCIVGEIRRGHEPPAFVMEMVGVLRQGERLRLAALMSQEERRAALWTVDGAGDV
ncbi:hypothetical protein NJLHNGOC_00980 [Novacetimonas cocois]|uniref:CheW-like domain-containing protein n=2 Tax=Novacetimonas cocois TaxID=1747507 RepID=A0A365Z0Y8_9PROT|nr:hypothetical protein NJLHNGOC_00980 [Novacetimonas cocois]